MKKTPIIILTLSVVFAMLFGCSNIKNSVTAEDLTLTEFSTTANSKEKQTEPKTTAASTEITTSEATETSTAKVSTTGERNTSKKSIPETTKKSQRITTVPKTTTVSKRTTTRAATTEKQVDKTHCTITIQCVEVLNNLGDLAEDHEFYVPKSGYLITNYSVKYEEGDTVYDVLKRTCRENGIKLTAKYTSYGMYVVGIYNLDEKDCGETSGWTYYVNGEFPPIAVDKYELNGGENIEFKYVC